MQLLLDTCAVIWISADAPFSAEVHNALGQAKAQGISVLISPISAWEIGLLVAKGHLALPASPHAWFERFMEVSNVELTDLLPSVLIASSFLPGSPPRDPSDRIMIATAREHGLTVVTRDSGILEYAAAGHVHALAC